MHLTALLLLASVLSPVKNWYSPFDPVEVNVNPGMPAHLVFTDFNGNLVAPAGSAEVSDAKTIDVIKLYPQLATGGYGVLFLVPKDKKISEFIGTPLVVEAITSDKSGKAGLEVINVQPLRYAVMQTKAGAVTIVFYYDAAHHTVDNFLHLAEEGFFDKLTFHRIVPGFVIQGGDPRGDGSGGPGYQVPAEFNDRQHLEGVLSMARNGDPLEPKGYMPRPNYANSGGSQFFVCLDYSKTKALDRKYTAFGRVVDGMDAVKQIAATPIANREKGTPSDPPVIEKIEVKPVTAAENPYADMLHMKEPTTAPAK